MERFWLRHRIILVCFCKKHRSDLNLSSAICAKHPSILISRGDGLIRDKKEICTFFIRTTRSSLYKILVTIFTSRLYAALKIESLCMASGILNILFHTFQFTPMYFRNSNILLICKDLEAGSGFGFPERA